MHAHAFFKVCLFWFFSIQLLKKHTLNPEFTLCVSISCSKSPVKSSQNLQHKFLDWKWPPPLWDFSKKSSNLVAGSFPRRNQEPSIVAISVDDTLLFDFVLSNNKLSTSHFFMLLAGKASIFNLWNLLFRFWSPIHREMAALSGKNITLIFSTTFPQSNTKILRERDRGSTTTVMGDCP